ncbi:MAG: hypothetical protein ACREFR_12020, partial [Limisphaerales bacterium]
PIVFSGETNTSPMMASPYPSFITVSNVGGVLVGATVTLTNYSDSSPQANEVLVVSPSLADTLLMSDIGSNQTKVAGLTLTFSNCIPPIYLPSGPGSPAITNGVYSPTPNTPITIFP